MATFKDEKKKVRIEKGKAPIPNSSSRHSSKRSNRVDKTQVKLARFYKVN